MQMTALYIILGLAIGIPLVMGLLLFFFQRRLLYPAPQVDLPDTLPPNIEKIEYGHGHGLFLNAATEPNDRRPVLIFIHGNAETAFLWSGAFVEILAAEMSVLLVEYPGYNGSSGRSTYSSIQQVMLESYDNLMARSDVDPTAIVAYGRSMGGAAATLLADNRPLAALCLEATFSSLKRLVTEMGFPSFLLRDRYDNAAILHRLEIPIFLYHGTEDPLIPFQHSRDLEKAARNATFVTGPYTHNNCPRPWEDVLQFLEANTTVELKDGSVA